MLTCRQNFTRYFLIALFFFASGAPVLAAGLEDVSFGSSGRAASGWTGRHYSTQILVQPDDKILVAGIDSSFGISVARYNAINGNLDNTFGSGGIVSLETERVNSSNLVLQPDGKIVVVGSTDLSTSSSNLIYYIARLNSNGSLDQTFGTAGEVKIDRTATTPGRDTLHSALILPNGKILVAGQRNESVGEIARLNSDGTLDTTFANAGFLSFTTPRFELIRSLLLTADGKILAAGDIFSSGAAIFRLNQDGTIDASFGQNGFVQLSDSTGIKLQPDGKIIASAGNNLRRFLPDGQLDPTFKIQPFGGATALLPDGRLVTTSNGGTLYLLAADGRIIGKARVPPPVNGADTSVFAHIGAQSDGRIIVSVISRSSNVPTFPWNFYLIRYKSLTSLANRIQDFDGDEKTDVGVFRPGNNTFYYLTNRNSQGFSVYTAPNVVNRPLTEDFQGDFLSDIVWTTAAQTSNFFCGFYGVNTPSQCAQWGLATDTPLGGDYDGDTKTDFTVYRNGIWYVLQSSTQTLRAIYWGLGTDKPVPADYDADGKTDTAVYRPSNGTWHVLKSSDNNFAISYFGLETDKPVPADYDGDGRADIAVYRSSNGFWYALQTTDGFTGAQFGASEDKPVPGDYDGDGKTDFAVWRPSNGFWYLRQSAHGFRAVQWGQNGDVPLSTTYSAD